MSKTLEIFACLGWIVGFMAFVGAQHTNHEHGQYVALLLMMVCIQSQIGLRILRVLERR